ncbi:cytohesin-interacting protein [Lampris incognitus]|uniref:cytohesin-interacting protein n=1 Tax=Lampris incognitus TaxID=2546036 RepID=UPI0024B5984E|nr:cytohesin-interacting protein [Lampris incognitus]
MQSIMNFNGLQRRGSEDSYILDNSVMKKGRLWYRLSLKGSNDRYHSNSETLPRGWKRTQQTSTNSLIDYADPQRTTVVLKKEDNESFGFEIQTYGVQVKNSSAVEMCTFVCKVQEDSAAESAGLTTGDVIIKINGVSIEGSSHQHIVDLIRESANLVKLETVFNTVVRRIELEKKVALLKQRLREKLSALQALTLQEKRLMRANLNDTSSHPSLESQVSHDSLTDSDGRRLSSSSSWRSVMTEDSVFGDLCSPSSGSAASTSDDSCFFSRDFTGPRRPISSPSPHQNLHRTSSSSLAGSSSSISPIWDEARASTLFGTLPRKGRRVSVRKHILKLIPRLQNSVEEEEMGPNAEAAAT